MKYAVHIIYCWTQWTTTNSLSVNHQALSATRCHIRAYLTPPDRTDIRYSGLFTYLDLDWMLHTIIHSQTNSYQRCSCCVFERKFHFIALCTRIDYASIACNLLAISTELWMLIREFGRRIKYVNLITCIMQIFPLRVLVVSQFSYGHPNTTMRNGVGDMSKWQYAKNAVEHRNRMRGKKNNNDNGKRERECS